jgi:tripartite-type tricarboxylate transporter receptor subunit TctC
VNVYCISQTLYHKLPFDAARDFSPVGIVARFPWTLAVHPSIPAQNVQQFVAWLKANPEKAICGMAAIGSEGHLMAYAFSRAAGVNITFAAYKGGAPMAQDLMAGHIPFAFDPIVNLAEPHNAGKVRVLAVTSAERSALLPEVPTFRELGFHGATGDTWIGAAVRAGTPPAQVQALATAFADAAGKADVQSRLAAHGLATVAAAPAVMAKTMESDTERYAGLVKAMGLKID